jgi:hypothetical protein
VLSIAAGVAGWRLDAHGIRLPALLAAVLAVLHSAATTQAAPTMFSQRWVQGDEAALARTFHRFAARWQAVRCALQLANLGVLLWLWVKVSRVAA